MNEAEADKILLDQNALLLALSRWLETQGVDVKLVPFVLARATGYALSAVSSNKEHMQEGLRIIKEVMQKSAEIGFEVSRLEGEE